MNALINPRFLRERGYEALFHVAGFMALALRPTMKHGFDLEQQIGDHLLRRRELETFRQLGLIEDGAESAAGVLRLTKLGQRALAGGRNPEEAWDRAWDGEWRLVTFDLPREARGVRAKFWRWLRANRFGCLQGSVWITPDPAPAMRKEAQEAGLEPTRLVLFTGQVDDGANPREIVARAWDFETINHNYQVYLDFVDQAHLQASKRVPSPAQLKDILRMDRKHWWKAVGKDPLLPRDLLPRGYQGLSAWKRRNKLHAILFRALKPDKPSD